MDRARREILVLGLVVLAVLAARPVSEMLATRPNEPPWQQCRIPADQHKLLHEDGDLALRVRVSGDTARLDGTMTTAVTCKLRSLIAWHPEVRRLELGEMAGTFDSDSTLEAGRIVREAGLAVHARPGSRIVSGAVDLFLAGVERSYAPGAEFGVHSWAYNDNDVEGRTLPRSDPQHRPHLEFYAEMGIDPAFYWFSIDAAGADEVHVMSEQELRRFGFATGGRSAAEQ